MGLEMKARGGRLEHVRETGRVDADDSYFDESWADDGGPGCMLVLLALLAATVLVTWLVVR